MPFPNALRDQRVRKRPARAVGGVEIIEANEKGWATSGEVSFHGRRLFVGRAAVPSGEGLEPRGAARQRPPHRLEGAEEHRARPSACVEASLHDVEALQLRPPPCLGDEARLSDPGRPDVPSDRVRRLDPRDELLRSP